MRLKAQNLEYRHRKSKASLNFTRLRVTVEGDCAFPLLQKPSHIKKLKGNQKEAMTLQVQLFSGGLIQVYVKENLVVNKICY
jgi:hypothetical protein